MEGNKIMQNKKILSKNTKKPVALSGNKPILNSEPTQISVLEALAELREQGLNNPMEIDEINQFIIDCRKRN